MNYEIKSQLTVVIENTPGSLAALSDTLAQHDISLNAVSINDSEVSGKVRFTVCNPEIAKRSLECRGYQTAIEDVLSIRLQDSKGRLAHLTKALFESGINIDYMYASVDQEGAGSRLILKVSNIHLAARVLEQLQVAA